MATVKNVELENLLAMCESLAESVAERDKLYKEGRGDDAMAADSIIEKAENVEWAFREWVAAGRNVK